MSKGKNNKTKASKNTVNKNSKNNVKKVDAFTKDDFITDDNTNKIPLIVGAILLLLVLLIGLFSCEKSEERKKEEPKEVTTTKPVTTTTKVVSNKKNNGGYKVNTVYYNNEVEAEEVINTVVVDTEAQKLSLAKEALTKAKETYAKEDILSVTDLINDLTDSEDKKALKEELEEVITTFNVIKLVENYEELIDSAENKEELSLANSYKQENEIEKNIEELKDEIKKEELNERITKVNEILTDDVAPIILGVEEGYYYNTDVSIEIIEDNLKEVRLNDELYNLGDEIPLDGIYTVTATDKAFNSSSVTFTLDRTKPVITLVGDEEVTVELGDTYVEEGATYEDNIDGLGSISMPDEDLVDTSAAGIYELTYTYTDIAGNTESIVRIVIVNESASPIIEYEKIYEDLYSKEYEFKITDDSKLEVVKILKGNKNIEDFQIDGEEIIEPYNYTFYENGEYTVYAKDILGNESIEVITIEGITKAEISLNELNNAIIIGPKTEVTNALYEKEISTNKEDELLVTEIKVVSTEFDDNHAGYEKVTTSSFANDQINGFDVEEKNEETFKLQDDLTKEDDNYHYVYFKVEKGTGLNKVVNENVILVEPKN